MTIKPPLARAVLVAAAILSGTAASAPANPQYEQAVAASGTWAENLRSYRLTGTMTMATGIQGQPGSTQMEAELTAAARFPDRLLSRQTGKTFNLSLGVGPEHSWFLLGQLNACYLADPVPLNRHRYQDDEFELEPARIFNFFGGLDQFLLPPDLKVEPLSGAATYTLGGRAVACQVFKSPGDGGDGQGPREYWYDPQSHLVMKTILTGVGNRGGQVMEQKLTFELKEFSLNEPVDEAVFAFTPPAGVRQVDHLDRLTNPDAMTGQRAPAVTFKDLDGNLLDLSDLKGKVVFLDFWATWCGPCKMEMPHIQTLHEELGKSGEVVFLAASSEDKAAIKPFIDKYGYTFRVVMVAAEDAHQLYKASSIPAGFVIDRDGVIRAHMVGAQSERQLRKALAKAGIGR